MGIWLVTLVAATIVSATLGGSPGAIAIVIALPVLVGIQLALSRTRPRLALVLTGLLFAILVGAMIISSA